MKFFANNSLGLDVDFGLNSMLKNTVESVDKIWRKQ
jgi:hypothetical protein